MEAKVINNIISYSSQVVKVLKDNGVHITEKGIAILAGIGAALLLGDHMIDNGVSVNFQYKDSVNFSLKTQPKKEVIDVDTEEN